MEYKIEGGNLPVLKCKLKKGESLYCEADGMSWMDDVFDMETNIGGGKQFASKLLTRERIFRNKYTAKADGEIAIASCFPGTIGAMEIKDGESLIAQDSAYLANFGEVDMSIFFQKKISSGLFGGKGFIMQKFSGDGIVFLEFDGSVSEYYLEEGERKIIDTGYLVAMEGTCKLEVVIIKGIKNVIFGGEGLFNAVVTGPGKVYIHSMPIEKTAAKVYYALPHHVVDSTPTESSKDKD